MQQITQLTPSNEVAHFVDDDQFFGNESTEKCAEEIGAMFYYSTPVGTPNPYTSKEVHMMAHADYVAVVGEDNRSDANGTTIEELHQLLVMHGFHYIPLSDPNFTLIDAWLSYGYPVILCVVEASVFDLELKTSPYPWNTAGINHVIMATGKGLFRDTANIVAPNTLRKGPRKYDTKKLQIVNATVACPSWLPVPPKDFDPTKPPESEVTDVDKKYWTLVHNAPLNPSSAIFKSWQEELKKNNFHGVPLSDETKIGELIIQIFSSSTAIWDGKSVSWK